MDIVNFSKIITSKKNNYYFFGIKILFLFLITLIIPGCFCDAPSLKTPHADEIDEIEVYGEFSSKGYKYLFSITDSSRIEEVVEFLDDYNDGCFSYPLGNTQPVSPYVIKLNANDELKLVIWFWDTGGYGGFDQPPYRGRSLSEEKLQKLKNLIFQQPLIEESG